MWGVDHLDLSLSEVELIQDQSLNQIEFTWGLFNLESTRPAIWVCPFELGVD